MTSAVLVLHTILFPLLLPLLTISAQHLAPHFPSNLFQDIALNCTATQQGPRCHHSLGKDDFLNCLFDLIMIILYLWSRLWLSNSVRQVLIQYRTIRCITTTKQGISQNNDGMEARRWAGCFSVHQCSHYSFLSPVFDSMMWAYASPLIQSIGLLYMHKNGDRLGNL